MTRLSKRQWQRYLFPAIALGFSIVWLLSTAVLWSNLRLEQQHAYNQIAHTAETELHSKVAQVENILRQTYHTVRTISLLPGVRNTAPSNRNGDTEDIVAMGRMSPADYDTVQQLYNHIGSSVAVSEIYIIYDGFDPLRGQVPFVMFDQIIVDKFDQQTQHILKDDDFPEEDETEEYLEYVRQLNYFRQHSFKMPDNLLDNITPINSGMLRTCDNSQYLSTSDGDERHTYGFTLSVPIYDLNNRQFKGLVTAILRNNVLEAALIGWPVLPVTDADRALLAATRNIDLNAPPANFLLEESITGIRISDTRHPDFSAVQKSAALHFQQALSLPGDHTWILHNYVPQALFDAARQSAFRHTALQIAALSVVLALLWLSVHASLKAQQNRALQLRQLANLDPLTGLPNRRMIGMYLNSILSATPRQRYFAVILIDLDDFKHVNDSIGHEAGDRMLIEVGQRFNRVLRRDDLLVRLADDESASDNVTDNDTDGFTDNFDDHFNPDPIAHNDADTLPRATRTRVIGRLGGDEFLVTLGDLETQDCACTVSKRLLAALQEPIEAGLEKIYTHASMGIAVYPRDGEDPAALLRSADIALYEAKRRGRGQTVMFSPELNADAMRRLKVTGALHEALHAQQFFLLYQPEMHVASGSINAAEVLLRWQHPEFGLVMPNEFIPLLERSGLIIEAGRWVLQTACQQFKAWADMGLTMNNISVNISPKQLAQQDFAAMVAEILTTTEVAAHHLVLEITESTFMGEHQHAIQSLTDVRRLGVRIAIDDFGTGYSSLSYLREIPLDILKIDRSFVIETHTENGAAICDMLIELAGRLDLKVVAEGIETPQQLQCLQASDWIQGYLIAKPLPASEFVKKVHMQAATLESRNYAHT